MSQIPSEPPKPNLLDCEPWPYRPREYAARVLWLFVWATVWRLCFWRWPLRAAILRVFGAKVGRSAFAGSVRIEMPWLLKVGSAVAVSQRAHLYNLGGVEIGDHTVISQDVYICGGTHDYTDPTYPLLRRKIVIGNYVWIAAGAFIGPGVTIGEGAVIGARAVVVKDVEPWTVVAGNPARFIKNRRMKHADTASAAPSTAPPDLSTQDGAAHR
jgi:putative colanic acid biosynthesis acetyltransferase WcaF